ncbi:DUF1679 domain-containing protein, partial [Chitinophagales bacterium]|nr:DUF1679 domain-containing protein [Chitinophagales bacterium]
IALDESIEHPRGWNTNNSHNRKVKSYQVETHWYKEWNQLCTNKSRVPNFIGSFSEGKEQWIILEDLNAYFPVRRTQLELSEMGECLKWLANFHATFLNEQPTGLWEMGTYWHLETRPDELEEIEHDELKSKAHLIDGLLNHCKFQTIVHGDAKLANFCFSENSDQVAAVDFQYVGGGCGMKDVVYFLRTCLSSTELELNEKDLLDYYFAELTISLKASKASTDFNDLEQEWRSLYPFACADYTRFLLGWMPSHQRINDYCLKRMNAVVANL